MMRGRLGLGGREGWEEIRKVLGERGVLLGRGGNRSLEEMVFRLGLHAGGKTGFPRITTQERHTEEEAHLGTEVRLQADGTNLTPYFSRIPWMPHSQGRASCPVLTSSSPRSRPDTPRLPTAHSICLPALLFPCFHGTYYLLQFSFLLCFHLLSLLISFHSH